MHKLIYYPYINFKLKFYRCMEIMENLPDIFSWFAYV